MDKNAIKKFATWARREMIERIRQQAYRFEVENAQADMNLTSAHGVVLTPQQRSQRQALIERIQAKGYDATIEEVAYTWFDRFCALRFMEVNGYLPGRTRMFSDDTGAFRPQILTDSLNIDLPGLDLDTVIRLKEENKTEELFKVLLLAMCNALKPILTLFQPDDRGCNMADRDYTFLLLPDNLLREGSVTEQMVLTIPEDDWKDAVQIVGWLYQYYNAEPKDQVFANLKKNIKISKKDIPAATQLFTPDWVVRYMVENSLGRLWVEGHPDDSLKANWKYYLEEAEQEPEVQVQLAQIREGYAALKPEDILCTDCCMGSGHILVYMFEVLVQIYEAYGYPTRDAVASIVQNNLWGLDIDDRAAQLANFAVMMVARRHDKGWFRRGIQPHVMAIQESNGINRDHLRYLGNTLSDIERHNATTQMEALLDEFIDAKEYGSILQPRVYDWEALRHFVRMTAPEQQVTLGEVGIEATQERLMQLIEQAQALAQKYHVVVTNPPYMNPGNSGGGLAEYVKKHYPEGKTDLFAVFIEHCNNLLNTYGIQGMITQYVWMYKTVYKEFRAKMLTHQIVNLIHLGPGAFDEISGEVVNTVSFIATKDSINDYASSFVRLTDYPDENSKRDGYIVTKGNPYNTKQQLFKLVAEDIYAYWVSDSVFNHLMHTPILDEVAAARKGLTTGDNDLFVRLWYELEKDRLYIMGHVHKWYPMTKGGLFRKWYGNNDFVINWENNGQALRCFVDENGKLRSVLRNTQYYLKESISWNDTSSGDLTFRYQNDTFIPNASGPCVYSGQVHILYLIGLLNSKVSRSFMSVLAPALKFEVGQVARFPVLFDEKKDELVRSHSTECIKISKCDWDSFETSWDFQQHPLVRLKPEGLHELRVYGTSGTGERVDIHAGVLEQAYMSWIREAYDRFAQLKTNEEELNRIFIDIYGLQDELTPDVADKDVTVRKADLGRDTRSLISYAVGCMFGRYSLDKPGLQFAGGDWIEWLAQQDTMTYTPDKDGILPITDDEYFGDDIVTMFVDWVKTVYGAETLEENLKFIASALYSNGGGSARELIRQYFLNDFFKDHCATYSVTGSGKRPIYWLFDSGKKNGFKALVYMHRWQKDTVARVRTDYVHEMQSRYRTAIDDLTHRVDSAAGSERVRLQKQLTKIQAQEAELLKYEEKVHHLADQMIGIDLDDGVKHNYAFFQDILAPIK